MSEKTNEKIDNLEEMDQVAGGAGFVLKGLFEKEENYALYVCPICKAEYKIPVIGYAGLLQCNKCRISLKAK